MTVNKIQAFVCNDNFSHDTKVTNSLQNSNKLIIVFGVSTNLIVFPSGHLPCGRFLLQIYGFTKPESSKKPNKSKKEESELNIPSTILQFPNDKTFILNV